MADGLVRNAEFLISENSKDLQCAKGNISSAMLDRLTLKQATIEGMAKGIKEVAALPDPVGRVTSMWRRPNGLQVGKMRIVGSPIRLSETPGEVYAPAPLLGEHSEEILKTVLDYTEEDIRALKAENVINREI